MFLHRENKMRALFLLMSFWVGFCFPVHADDLKIATDLYNSTKIICSGISDELAQISGISKAGTAVSAVGTAAAGGAMTAGIMKANIDREIENFVQEICAKGGCDIAAVEKMSDMDFFSKLITPMADFMEKMQAIEDASKKLGNWRTGLMAGTIATNLATTIMSGVNRNQSELIQQITACNIAVAQLAPYKGILIAAGISPLQEPIVNKIDGVATWCQPIDVADIEKIEKRMTAVMGVGVAGTAVGVAGTATSAVANTDKIRDDNSKEGKLKEKRLNTTANVLAGVNVATGATELGLNISLITLSKKLIKQAKLCEEAF